MQVVRPARLPAPQPAPAHAQQPQQIQPPLAQPAAAAVQPQLGAQVQAEPPHQPINHTATTGSGPVLQGCQLVNSLVIVNIAGADEKMTTIVRNISELASGLASGLAGTQGSAAAAGGQPGVRQGEVAAAAPGLEISIPGAVPKGACHDVCSRRADYLVQRVKPKVKSGENQRSSQSQLPLTVVEFGSACATAPSHRSPPHSRSDTSRREPREPASGASLSVNVRANPF